MRDLSIVSNQKNFSDHKLCNISCPVCITNPPLPLMGNTLVFNQIVQIINDAAQPMASLVVTTCTSEVINLLYNHPTHLFSSFVFLWPIQNQTYYLQDGSGQVFLWCNTTIFPLPLGRFPFTPNQPLLANYRLFSPPNNIGLTLCFTSKTEQQWPKLFYSFFSPASFDKTIWQEAGLVTLCLF